jgi:hypothetical protein
MAAANSGEEAVSEWRQFTLCLVWRTAAEARVGIILIFWVQWVTGQRKGPHLTQWSRPARRSPDVVGPLCLIRSIAWGLRQLRAREPCESSSILYRMQPKPAIAQIAHGYDGAFRSPVSLRSTGVFGWNPNLSRGYSLQNCRILNF